MTSAVVQARPSIRRREIRDDDLRSVAAFLSRGFRMRPVSYWLRGLQRQIDRQLPEGSPKYGYMLLDGETIVGTILMFSATVDTENGPVQRCNLSSWFVDPKYRQYGALLITSVLKNKDVTYYNVSPVRHSWETVEAQGFKAYCRGEMTALPILSGRKPGVVVERVTDKTPSNGDYDFDLLKQHARFGCLSVIVHQDGKRYPFVFVKQKIIKRLIPCVRLIYCRDIDDFAQFAGDLGWFLMRYGRLVAIIDAAGPVPGLVGHYTESKGRKYMRGPQSLRLGDQAFSEMVYFG